MSFLKYTANTLFEMAAISLLLVAFVIAWPLDLAQQGFDKLVSLVYKPSK